jgi:hypothetical protein
MNIKRTNHTKQACSQLFFVMSLDFMHLFYYNQYLLLFLWHIFIIISSNAFEIVFVDEFLVNESLFLFRGEEGLIFGNYAEVSKEVFWCLSFKN